MQGQALHAKRASPCILLARAGHTQAAVSRAAGELRVPSEMRSSNKTSPRQLAKETCGFQQQLPIPASVFAAPTAGFLAAPAPCPAEPTCSWLYSPLRPDTPGNPCRAQAKHRHREHTNKTIPATQEWVYIVMSVTCLEKESSPFCAFPSPPPVAQAQERIEMRQACVRAGAPSASVRACARGKAPFSS
ncbi:hypothetical protein NDU88_001868 [Pleurodeles waltl]|uniref:Uncharacterized protein n=1 Tax=Pleurodeles waltl TaxID=8319 RepID=A0AAV7Q534_PLEWA|nr:hypothetical protein NDU88_001868 [Pleurodeles waltl]